MKYTEYRDAILSALRGNGRGMTWPELRAGLRLPYERPCPTWTRQLEEEIGLRRVKGEGSGLVWRIGSGLANVDRKPTARKRAG
jgi:hypothetical protein